MQMCKILSFQTNKKLHQTRLNLLFLIFFYQMPQSLSFAVWVLFIKNKKNIYLQKEHSNVLSINSCGGVSCKRIRIFLFLFVQSVGDKKLQACRGPQRACRSVTLTLPIQLTLNIYLQPETNKKPHLLNPHAVSLKRAF